MADVIILVPAVYVYFEYCIELKVFIVTPLLVQNLVTKEAIHTLTAEE